MLKESWRAFHALQLISCTCACIGSPEAGQGATWLINCDNGVAQVAARAGASGAQGAPLLAQAVALGARYGADAWALRMRFAEAALLGAPAALPPRKAEPADDPALPAPPADNGDATPADRGHARVNGGQGSAVGLGPGCRGAEDPQAALAAVQAALLARPAQLLAALAHRVLPALGSMGPAGTPRGADPDAGEGPGCAGCAPGALAAALSLAEECVRTGGAAGMQVHQRCYLAS